MCDRLPSSVIPDRPDEGDDGSGARVRHERLGLTRVETVALDAKPRILTAADGWNQRDLIAISQWMIRGDVCLIDHEHSHRPHAGEPRVFRDQLVEELPGRRAIGHAATLGRRADDLADQGKVANVNVHAIFSARFRSVS
jgi:hypothetical protein